MSDYPPLHLHVPEPSGRPGREPDFSYLHLAPAGAVRRPPIDARPSETGDVADALVRVLDDDGPCDGPVGSARRRPTCCSPACARC